MIKPYPDTATGDEIAVITKVERATARKTELRFFGTPSRKQRLSESLVKGFNVLLNMFAQVGKLFSFFFHLCQVNNSKVKLVM